MLSTGAAAYIVVVAGRGAAGLGCLILGANFRAADQPADDLAPPEGPAALALVKLSAEDPAACLHVEVVSALET